MPPPSTSSPMGLDSPRGAAPGGIEAWAVRRWVPALIAIAAYGLVARLLYLHQLAALPFFSFPIGDSAAHLKRAGEIAAGVWLPTHPLYYCSIPYPYFLALILNGLHGSLIAVCGTQVAVGVAVLLLLAHATRRMFGAAAGLAVALLGALYGPFAFLEADILGVVWGQLALALAIALCLAWVARRAPEPRRGGGLLFGAGLAFGAAILERPNLLVPAALAIAWCGTQAESGRRLRAAAAPVLGMAALLWIPLAMNVAGSGQWVPLTTSSGINLSLGLHHGADGTFHEPWESRDQDFSARHTEPEDAMVARASAEVGRQLTPQQASSYWTRQALTFVRERPAEAAALTLRKLGLMLGDTEVANHFDFAFIRECAPALALMPIGFAAILGLSVIGLGAGLASKSARPGTWLLLAIGGGIVLGTIPFTVADRYRAPLVVPLLVGAGAGLVHLVGFLRDRGRGARARDLALLAGALAVTSLSMVPLFHSARSRDYWMFAQAYEAQGRHRAAIAAYQAASAEDPADGSILNNLAMAYKNEGDRAEAAAVLRRAIRVDPALSYPHRNLAMLLIAAGEQDAALAELRRAVRLDSTDATSYAAMGAMLAERNAHAEAALDFAIARRLAPNDARIARLMSSYPDATPPRPIPGLAE